MKLIVGLGNPGRQYERTRHNLGFMVADRLAARWSIGLGTFGSGVFGKGNVSGQSVGLLKPMTFMNRSGQAVLEVVQFYKVPLSDLLVVYDELDLPIGKVRMRAGGSAGGHKGMQDIINRLGDDAIARVRIGIDKPKHGDTVSYVLTGFTVDEQPLVETALDWAADAAECWLKEGPDAAMNRYNRNQGTQPEQT